MRSSEHLGKVRLGRVLGGLGSILERSRGRLSNQQQPASRKARTVMLKSLGACAWGLPLSDAGLYGWFEWMVCMDDLNGWFEWMVCVDGLKGMVCMDGLDGWFEWMVCL